MRKFLQNFNAAGISQFIQVYNNDKSLAIPHLKCNNLKNINWHMIKRAGFKGVIFDKDNTLTLPFSHKLNIKAKEGLEQCKQVFPNACILFSNSAGMSQYDPKGEEAELLEKELGIDVLRHKEKKPAGSALELENYFNCKSFQLIMVGDRFLTDIVFGNKHNMLTIYVQPFDVHDEPFGVKMSRYVENNLVEDWIQNNIQAPTHNLIEACDLDNFFKD